MAAKQFTMHDLLAAKIAKGCTTPGTSHLIATVLSLDKNFAFRTRTCVYTRATFGGVFRPFFKHLVSSFKVLAAH